MKKRLRKKKHVAEFQELSFLVKAEFETTDEDALWERFVAKVEELDFLCMGTFGNSSIDLCIECGFSGAEEEERKQKLLDWLEQQPEIKKCSASKIFDSYYGVVED